MLNVVEEGSNGQLPLGIEIREASPLDAVRHSACCTFLLELLAYLPPIIINTLYTEPDA